MSADTQGAQAEQRAAHYLQQQGLKLIAQNYRGRFGEIDLILQDGATLVFVEVRLRSNRRFGGAAASITAAKRRRLIRAAGHYLAGRPMPVCRFDAVLLDRLDAAGIEWIRNAFDAL